MTTARRHLAALVGLVLVAGHFLLLLVLFDRCRRDDLTVQVTAPPAARTARTARTATTP